jgi:hypothetical protein
MSVVRESEGPISQKQTFLTALSPKHPSFTSRQPICITLCSMSRNGTALLLYYCCRSTEMESKSEPSFFCNRNVTIVAPSFTTLDKRKIRRVISPVTETDDRLEQSPGFCLPLVLVVTFDTPLTHDIPIYHRAPSTPPPPTFPWLYTYLHLCAPYQHCPYSPSPWRIMDSASTDKHPSRVRVMAVILFYMFAALVVCTFSGSRRFASLIRSSSLS